MFDQNQNQTKYVNSLNFLLFDGCTCTCTIEENSKKDFCELILF